MKTLRIPPKLYCFILGLTMSAILFTVKYEWNDFSVIFKGMVILALISMLGIAYYFIRFYE